MTANEPFEHYYRLESKIGETEKILRQEIADGIEKRVAGECARIDKLELECVRKSEITHYATKFLAGSIAVGIFCALCAAYVVITPMFIDSKNSKLNEEVEQTLGLVKSHFR